MCAPNRGSQRGRAGAAQQRHARLVGRQVAFLHVARHAGEHEVFPSVAAAARTRDHMVDGEFRLGMPAAAVLAHVPVAQEDVAARQAHLLLHVAVEVGKHDDLGHAHAHGRRVDVAASAQAPAHHGKLAPGFEIVEGVVEGVNDPGMVLKKQSKRPLEWRDIDGHPGFVEHKYLRVGHGRSPGRVAGCAHTVYAPPAGSIKTGAFRSQTGDGVPKQCYLADSAAR